MDLRSQLPIEKDPATAALIPLRPLLPQEAIYWIDALLRLPGWESNLDAKQAAQYIKYYSFCIPLARHYVLKFLNSPMGFAIFSIFLISSWLQPKITISAEPLS